MDIPVSFSFLEVSHFFLITGTTIFCLEFKNWKGCLFHTNNEEKAVPTIKSYIFLNPSEM